MNAHAKLRASGWSAGPAQKSFTHPSGATAVLGPSGWRAKRTSGEEQGGFAYRGDALAWALEQPAPKRHVPKERPTKPRETAPAGDWTGPVRGLLRHVSGGTLDLGGTSRSSVVATLRSGERRVFRDRQDARRWVEGGGVWPAGYVPAERRGT